MLKYFFLFALMVPYLSFNWRFYQVLFFLGSLLFMSELGTFEHFESLGGGMGLDLMSYGLILLSIWVCSLMIMSSSGILSSSFFGGRLMFSMLILVIFLVLSFFSTNLFLFYLFFESSLIPTFALILGWGFQSERLQAGVYLLLYTLVSSLPLLLMIFFWYKSLSTLNVYSGGGGSGLSFNLIMFVFFYSAFLVKLPMYMVHLWLPKAHVEAPVAGSMILAGVLLKLGGYGILRVSKALYSHILGYSLWLIMLSVVGGVAISLNCLRQSDMKLLIAYSSVSHMGLFLGGALTWSMWGMSSALVMMLGHGLCSSGLFFLVNVGYERVGSRSLLFVKGMLHVLPKMALWWFLFSVMNMAAPPSINLLSEIGLINSLVGFSGVLMIPLGLTGLLAAGYSLYLFSFSQHGKLVGGTYSFFLNNAREYVVLLLHWIPLNGLILNSELLMCWV